VKEEREALDHRLDDLGPPLVAVPEHRSHPVRSADAGDGAALGVVEDEPGIDAPHPVDESDDRHAVVPAGDGPPGTVLDVDLHRPLGRRKGVVGFHRRPVLGRPALDKQASHRPAMVAGGSDAAGKGRAGPGSPVRAVGTRISGDRWVRR
jgi:hypothetical protein